MKKVFAVVIIVVLLGGGYLLISNGSGEQAPSNNDSTGDNSSATANTTPTDEVTDMTSGEEVNIAINNSSFSPKNIRVAQGTTVTWTNNDGLSHTVTGQSGGPSSETLDDGDTYSYTFNEVGTFDYFCEFHSGMTGSVQVVQ